jgi:hypothetical protein
MRLTSRHFAATFAAVTAAVLTACQSSDLPMPPNGPQGQGFSTNNALIRIVNGSPTAGSPCTVAGQATTCVDVVIDGTRINPPPGLPGFPYPTIPLLNSAAILPYVSVLSGPVLIQIFQSGTTNLVFETQPKTPLVLSANNKYSFAIAGQAVLPPPALPFFQGYLFKDGLYQAVFGGSMTDFHNASPNAGSLQYNVTCAACPVGGQNIGAAAGPGGVVGPTSLVPSSNYAFNATNSTPTTMTITAANLNGLNVSGVIPDPFGKQNISIYAVDTAGLGAGNFQLIGVEDTNG